MESAENRYDPSFFPFLLIETEECQVGAARARYSVEYKLLKQIHRAAELNDKLSKDPFQAPGRIGLNLSEIS